MADNTTLLGLNLALLVPGVLEDDAVREGIDGLTRLPGRAVRLEGVLGLVLAAAERELLVVVEEVRVVLRAGLPLLTVGLQDLLRRSLSSSDLALGVRVRRVVAALPVVCGRAVVVGAHEKILGGGDAVGFGDGVAADHRGQQQSERQESASELHLEGVD